MVIGALEKNKVRDGYHFHVIVVFNRSQGLRYAQKTLLYNQKLNPFDWYLATRYTRCRTLEAFKAYAIKNGIRYETKDEKDDTEEINNTLNDIATNITQTQSEIKNLAIIQRNKLRLHHARILDVDWFLENDFNFYLSSQCKSLFANCQHRPDLQNLEILCNYFIYGEPGTGKSSLVDFLFHNCYRKLKTNEKWDSYSNYLKEHETVYFDEMDTLEIFDRCMGGVEEFKTFTDVYPFPVRSNYGNQQVMIRPKRFVISSNFTPSQIFSKPNKFGQQLQNLEMILKAFNRRFKVLHIDEMHTLTETMFHPILKRTYWADSDEAHDYYEFTHKGHHREISGESDDARKNRLVREYNEYLNQKKN
jgi:hypothetical protein